MSDLIKSKRFWVAVSGLAVVVTSQFLPSIPEETVTNVVMILASWIVGETFRPVSGAVK
jgi:hypothetical protein